MKRKFLYVIGILLLAVIGVLAYFETHFTCYESKEVRISDERILKEMPDIALTDADLALGETILSNPEVMEAMEAGEIVSLPDTVAKRLAKGYLPEDVELFDCFVWENAVYFEYFETPEKKVMLTYFQDNVYGPYKDIALYRGDDLKAIYGNRDGDLKKYKDVRRWFAYFRDRMWED